MKDFGDFAELVKEIYPVVGLVAYGNGNYEVVREAKVKSKQPRIERGQIKMCSKNSLKRLIFLMQITETDFGSMFTATYPKIYPRDGKIVHEDINALANKFRRFGFKYVWFLEFQARGAPHVHWLLNAAGVSPRMRVDFGLYWTNRIAQSPWFLDGVKDDNHYHEEVIKMVNFNTHRKVWEVLRDEGAAKKYVAKYASKEIQKTVPKRFSNVGRFWGSTTGLKPEGIKLDATEDEVEEWLARKKHPMSKKELVPKYLWQVGALVCEQGELGEREPGARANL